MLESKAAKIRTDSVADARAELTEGHTNLSESMFGDVGGSSLAQHAVTTFTSNSKRTFGDDAEQIIKAAKKAKAYDIDFERANIEEKLTTWYQNEKRGDVISLQAAAAAALRIAQDIDPGSMDGLSKWVDILSMRMMYFDKVLGNMINVLKHYLLVLRQQMALSSDGLKYMAPWEIFAPAPTTRIQES